MSYSVRPQRQQPTRLPRPWDSPGKNTGVGCHFLLQCMKVKSQSEVAQSCPTPSNPMDCSLPGSSVHGIFQARVLEWCHCLLRWLLLTHDKLIWRWISWKVSIVPAKIWKAKILWRAQEVKNLFFSLQKCFAADLNDSKCAELNKIETNKRYHQQFFTNLSGPKAAR